MSYKLYTFRLPDETAADCGCLSLLLQDTRKAWSRVVLVGEGEHEGTSLLLTKEQLYQYDFNDSRQLAAVLDRLFLRAHGRRHSAEVIE
jgi:hypothetical protein